MALDFYHGHGSPYSWRAWLALESFPLTASGKIRKVEVEKMFEAEAATSA